MSSQCAMQIDFKIPYEYHLYCWQKASITSTWSAVDLYRYVVKSCLAPPSAVSMIIFAQKNNYKSVEFAGLSVFNFKKENTCTNTDTCRSDSQEISL